MKKEHRQFRELSIEVTHRCHYNCIFCSSSAGKTPLITDEIKLERIQEIIIECKDKFHIEKISLSGGEPIIYKDFYKLTDFILKNNLDLILYTTGLLSNNGKLEPWNDDLISFFADLQLKYQKKIFLVFDIQSSNKEIYEEITGQEESFEKLLITLKKLFDLDFDKSAHFVPFKKNWLNIEDLMIFLKNNNIQKLHILRYVSQGRGKFHSNFELDKDEFKILQKNLIYLKEKYKKQIRIGHPIDFRFLINPKYSANPCRGGIDAPIILPNGNVYPCPAWKNIPHLSAGNIYKENFENIWNSPYFTKFKDFIDFDYVNILGPCMKCEFLDGCKGKCVAQRILYNNRNPKYPNCLYIGCDPLCIRSLEKTGG